MMKSTDRAADLTTPFALAAVVLLGGLNIVAVEFSNQAWIRSSEPAFGLPSPLRYSS
jgi:hypothetical protein